jgi:uncharacterized membrane protein (UPF0127 family)
MTPTLTARNVTRATELAADLEVADSLLSRFMGLMGRPGLEDRCGLWLTGTNGIHMMFMRFPIDAVFLGRSEAADGGLRPVLSVHPGLRTWTGLVPLVRGAAGVLELPVGTIARSGTVVGDRVALGAPDEVAAAG